jgi:hypothetical protein
VRKRNGASKIPAVLSPSVKMAGIRLNDLQKKKKKERGILFLCQYLFIV